MQDSLVVEEGMMVKILLIIFFLLLQLLLQGSFHQDKVKQPHSRETQTPTIMNYLPLATLPFFARSVQSLWQELVKKVQAVLTHVGGPWRQPSLNNNARQICGQVDGTQKDQLCHLLHHFQDKNRLSEAHEVKCPSAETWT